MTRIEPQMPLEVIPEAEMSEATDKAIRDLLCKSFPADAEAFAHSRAWHESDPAFSVIYLEAGAVLGHIGIVIRSIRCGDTPVTVAGVQNMCVAVERRRTGLSRVLMARAMDEVVHHGVCYGLLFCLPELERFYCSLGWSKIDRPVTMLDEHRQSVPIPAKNIVMISELAGEGFPPGPVDLAGRDW